MVEFALSPQQKELRAKVREFAIREILPASWYYDEKNDIPLFLLQKAFDAGFMNGDIPERYGGKGVRSSGHGHSYRGDRRGVPRGGHIDLRQLARHGADHALR